MAIIALLGRAVIPGHVVCQISSGVARPWQRPPLLSIDGYAYAATSVALFQVHGPLPAGGYASGARQGAPIGDPEL